MLGYYAGYLATGGNNTLLGYRAGDNITTGTDNIILGYNISTPAVGTSSYLSIGNLIFASGGFGTGTTVGAGNVGIGTTNPLQKLHVEGQCVTGDTLLSIVKSKEFSMINDQFSNNDSISNDKNLEYKRIDQVKSGDQVLSLDEKTGKLVPARIKGLLDMGVKPIFKITTEDGREIRTTGNHPYLTKEGWTKVASLEEGERIAVAKDDLSSGS
ncbi:MAG: hypothetical protein QMD77_05325, partial [Patescibacteria group bacterium]|nr:hypothetical protein [Patescibacteria group bacterium]